MSSPGGGSLSVGTVSAKLDMDTAAFTRGLSKANAGMSETAAKGEASGNRISKAFKSIGSAIGELAIYEFAKEAVTAYATAETSVTKLNDVIAKTKSLSDGSKEGIATFSEQVQKLNEQMSQKSRFDMASLNSGAAVLAQFHMTGAQLLQNIPILVDYAARTGQTLPVAAAALGKATLGATKPLKTLGITFKATHDQAKDMATVFALVGAKTKGYAETDLGTAAGKMANFKKQIEEIEVALGGVLVPVLESVAGPIGILASGAQKAAEGFGKLPGPIKDAALALGAIMILGKVGLFTSLTRGMSGLGQSFQMFRLGHDAIESNVQGVSRLGLVGRQAAVGIGAVGKGIMGAFGGPLGLALAGVTIGIGLFAAASARAAAQARATQAVIDALAETANKATGALSEASISTLEDSLKSASGGFDAAGTSLGEVTAALLENGPAVDTLRQKILAANKATVEHTAATSTDGIIISQNAAMWGSSASKIEAAALRGGKAQSDFIASLGLTGHQADLVGNSMDGYRASVQQAVPALGALNAGQVEVQAELKKTSDEFRFAVQGAAAFAKIDPPKITPLIDALQKAAAGGKSLESVFAGVGIPLAQAKVAIEGIASKDPDISTSAKGLHYFSDAAAEVADNTDPAATAVKGVGDAAKGATIPVKAIKDALDAVSTAADTADQAAQGLELDLDRLTGNSVAAADALRLQAATLRGIGGAQRDLVKSTLDITDKTLALKKAQNQKVDKDHSAADNALAVQQATLDLKDSRADLADKTDAVAVADEAAAKAMIANASAAGQATVKTKGLAAGADAASASMVKGRATFIAAAEAAGLLPAQANKIADSYHLIPTEVRTAILAEDGTLKPITAAQKRLNDLKDKMLFIKSEDATAPGVLAARKRLAAIADKKAKVTADDKTAAGVGSAKKAVGSVPDHNAKITATDGTGPAVGTAKANVGSVEDRLARITAADQTGGGVGSAKVSLSTLPGKAVSITARDDTGPGIAQANASLNLVEDRLTRISAKAAAVPVQAGATPHALGGAISGGVAGKDSVLINAMPGEHMLTTGDVAKLGGQAGVYRFRKALEAGKVPKYAAGGAVPSGASLAGSPAFQPGDREGNVTSALGNLSSAVADFAAAAADARSAAADAKGKLGDAKGSQRSTASEQAGKVADVRSKDNAKLLAAENALSAARSKSAAATAAQQAHQAAAIRSAEEALNAARNKGAKTAAQQASKNAAIVKAEEKLTAARDHGSGASSAAIVKAEQHLTAVRQANAQALAKATAAQHNANAAQNAAVRSAQNLANATARTAAADTARAALEARTQAAEAGNRAQLVALGRAYDANVVKIGGLQTALDDLNSKAADTTSGIAGNVAGIGGGVLGSDAFTGSATTVSDMITSLQQNLDTAKGFDANIAKLVGLGLNPAQAEKVANADPTGRGGVVAASLAGASKAQIAQINALLAAEAAAGTTTGKRVATAEYGAQIDTATLQIKAAQLNMKIEAAEAAKIGAVIAAATRAAMTGQRVQITVGAAQLNGIIASVVKTETSAAVRQAAGRR